MDGRFMSKYEKLDILKVTYEKIRTLHEYCLQIIQSVTDQDEMNEINKFLYTEMDDHGRELKDDNLKKGE